MIRTHFTRIFIYVSFSFMFFSCRSEEVFDSSVAKPTSADAQSRHTAAVTGGTNEWDGSKSRFTEQNLLEIRALFGEKFRVKDAELLRGTLSCVNANLVVPADAIKQIGMGNPAGKTRFVPPSVTANSDIIAIKKADLYDPKSEGRETASASEATINYLNAATLVAEVVAHNADVTNITSKAYCATPDAARALIMRCVPTITPERLAASIDGGKNLVERMAEQCSSGQTAADKQLNSRIALASFLSSWLFLKSER